MTRAIQGVMRIAKSIHKKFQGIISVYIIILKDIIAADNLFIFVHPVYRLIVAIAKLQSLPFFSVQLKKAPRSLHASLKAPQSLETKTTEI